MPTSFRLTGDLLVDVLVPVGDNGDHLVLTGRVVELGESTVAVSMSDGAAALTVAAAKRCVLVWGPEEHERCALVRTGRRADDVLSPTTIELVLEDVRPLTEVIHR